MISDIISIESRDILIDIIRNNQKSNPLIFLDSQFTEHPSNEKSWLFTEFKQILVYKKGVAIRLDSNGTVVDQQNIDPWVAMTNFRSEFPGFYCGFFGYDLKNYTEDLHSDYSDEINMPELWMGYPSKIYCYSIEKDSGLETQQKTEFAEDHESNPVQIQLKKLIPKNEYVEKIQVAQQLIHDGDIYEVNLSHQIEAEILGNPVDLYQEMYKRGPVPYAAYMNLGDTVICCASPERFLKRKGNKLISDPIKGTRPRGVTDESDSVIKNELLLSEKDKAENLMIVDLVRNDLSRVSRPGSVCVTSLFDVQSFGTVHQLVSRVESEISEGITSEEAILNCFPMGSMTGAPKIRAMEVIEELEQYRRGIYSGAIGFFEPNGDFNFNVVIRSCIIRGKKLWYSAGGAITSDSDPDQEWEETLVKIRALGLDLSDSVE